LYQDSGFAFTLKKTDLEGELPKGFINVAMKKGKWLFSSMELVPFSSCPCVLFCLMWLIDSQKKMNARMKDALDETLILSDKRAFYTLDRRRKLIPFESRIIQDLVAEIVVDVGALYKASEAVTPHHFHFPVFA
jgi:DNA mismatch repair protein MSH4